MDVPSVVWRDIRKQLGYQVWDLCLCFNRFKMESKTFLHLPHLLFRKVLLPVFDDWLFALAWWSKMGGDLVQRSSTAKTCGAVGALMFTARSPLLHISAKKSRARSGWTLLYLLFPPHFRTTWAPLTPSLNSSLHCSWERPSLHEAAYCKLLTIDIPCICGQLLTGGDA